MYKADGYVEAYQATDGGQRRTRVRHWVPSARQLPMLTECEDYHEESVEVLVTVPEGKDSCGADYVVWREVFKQWKDTLKPRGDSVAKPEMFEHLAKIEEPREDDHPVRAMGCHDASNHLALVLADGNRMSDFSKKIVQLKNPQAHKALSRTLDDATRKAAERVREAAITAMANPKFYPDVLHCIGGNDVTASIADRFAWLWAITFAEAFESEFRSRVGDVYGTNPQLEKIETAARQASLGVGMVFTCYRVPLAGARELTEKMERIAKETGKGEKSYIAWVDATADHKALERDIIDAERASRELREGHVLRDLGPNARGALKQGLDAGRGAVAWTRRTKRDTVECLEQSSEDQTRANLDRARQWPVVEETREGQK